MPSVYNGEAWTIDCFVSGFSNNSFLITCRDTGKSIIIDAPDAPTKLIDAARSTEVTVILITHNHWDHIQGLDEVVHKFPAPVGIGTADADAFYNKYNPLPFNVTTISDGMIFKAGSIILRSIETSGHTYGSTCFMLPAESPSLAPHLFSGDTLFPGGPGKTGSPEAFSQILESIETRLLTLPSHTRVLPGHGQFTSISKARAEYAIFKSRPHSGSDFGDVRWTG